MSGLLLPGNALPGHVAYGKTFSGASGLAVVGSRVSVGAMAPGAGNYVPGTTSPECGAPPIVTPGDLLFALCVFYASGQPMITPPSGWSAVGSPVVLTTSGQGGYWYGLYIFTKTATSSDSSSSTYTWSSDRSTNGQIVLDSYSQAVLDGSPATASGASSTSFVGPNATTTMPYETVLVGAGVAAAQASMGYANAQVVDAAQSSNSQAGVIMGRLIGGSTPGSITTGTFSAPTTAATWAGFAVPLKPGPA